MNKVSKLKTTAEDFIRGLWQQNPTFRMLIGMCPTLAVTNQAKNGLAMGLATSFTLISSSFIISIFRKLIPKEIRMPAFVVIIATFVTMVDFFLKANFPQISKALGPYVPLIIVNCLILGRQEAFASKNPTYRALADAFGMGLGFTLSLLTLSITRETLGMGTIFGLTVLPSNFKLWNIMLTPPGAFLNLGIMLGIINLIDRYIKKKSENKEKI